ncbi:HNH endonuclease signature motif containing protein [Agromyces sp. M3QZ16-3]|uniref:HNH endonuclease signature motif containing protein n=1 Tax=Agromyces sp. M3QZ16-3 TaxID=3447585 RepID=UPI003F69495C
MEQSPTPQHPPGALAALLRDVAALREVWRGGSPATGAARGAQVEVERLSDAGLKRVTDALAKVQRDVDAALARVAAEVSRRSGPEFGETGFAKAQGFHNPTRLIASATGGSLGDARRLITVGTATAERQTFTGERLPSRRQYVAEALEAAAISIEAASAITTMLDRASMRSDPDRARVVERALVDLAGQVPLETLLRGVREAEARLDPDGVEPREDELRMERSLTIREDRRGMVHLTARLDPESAAPVKAAIEALVSDVLRRREQGARSVGASAVSAGAVGTGPVGTGPVGGGAGGGELRPVVDDHRTIPQVQADALATLARHTLGCTQTLTPLAKTTVIVRVDLDALVEGIGHARIDGLEQPISPATARRMAADADIIPAVLGGESLPLDLGRAARLFTKAQRLALGERDGGCASCGQNIGYVEAHHIDWWERDAGPTDLSNGVLLCSFCHHMIHRDGWRIHAGPTDVWFIPPPQIDPARVPRLGGRARFELRDDLAA